MSDGANWQVIDEALGQVPECKVYLNTKQSNILDSLWISVAIDTESYDIGSNYDISTWISGTARATTAFHLIDTTANPFTAAMVGRQVKNTTDSTYTHILAYHSTSDVQLQDNIFVNTEEYLINNTKFVSPISGKYEISCYVTYSSIAADKEYYSTLYKNGAGLLKISKHAADIGGWSSPNAITIDSLSINDYIELYAYNGSSVPTVDLESGIDRTCLMIRLISKD